MAEAQLTGFIRNLKKQQMRKNNLKQIEGASFLRKYKDYNIWEKKNSSLGAVLGSIIIQNKAGEIEFSIPAAFNAPDSINKAIEEGKREIDKAFYPPLSSTEEIATTFNGFQFNENGVCLNPEQVLFYYSKKISYQITVCETKEGFTYGYDWNIKGTMVGAGGSAGCASLNRAFYARRDMAILAAAHKGRAYFSGKGKLFPAKELADLENLILNIQN
jgi:hypothetical protein